MDSFSAQLPVGLASPAKPPLPPPTATSSQRSAGTFSGGEVAQLPVGALAPAGSLKRALSSCAEAGAEDSDTSSQGYSKSQRGSVAATPARRPSAQLARSAWGPADSGDEAADSAAGSGDDGLEFLLRACEMLDPHLEVARWVLRAGVHSCMHGWVAAVAGGCRTPCSPCVLLCELGWNKWWQKSRVAASCRQLGGMSAGATSPALKLGGQPPALVRTTHPCSSHLQAHPRRFGAQPATVWRRPLCTRHPKDHPPVAPRRRQPGGLPCWPRPPPGQPPPAGARRPVGR